MPEHPAVYHMLDVAAVAERLIAPFQLTLGLRDAFVLLIALHDLGKISDSFRAMVRGAQALGPRHWELTEVLLHKHDDLLAVRLGGEERMALAQTEGMAWLSRQGEKAGFKLLQAQAEDYSVEVLEGHRGPRKGQPQFGILDLIGHIEITDPVAFLAQVSQGFGRAKAFGCGLMLIRRAP